MNERPASHRALSNLSMEKKAGQPQQTTQQQDMYLGKRNSYMPNAEHEQQKRRSYIVLAKPQAWLGTMMTGVGLCTAQ